MATLLETLLKVLACDVQDETEHVDVMDSVSILLVLNLEFAAGPGAAACDTTNGQTSWENNGKGQEAFSQKTAACSRFIW